LEALVLELLAKDPAARPASAGELARRLKALETPDAWDGDVAAAWWDRKRDALRRIDVPVGTNVEPAR
jgi:hypothetical protein